MRINFRYNNVLLNINSFPRGSLRPFDNKQELLRRSTTPPAGRGKKPKPFPQNTPEHISSCISTSLPIRNIHKSSIQWHHRGHERQSSNTKVKEKQDYTTSYEYSLPGRHFLRGPKLHDVTPKGDRHGAVE